MLLVHGAGATEWIDPPGLTLPAAVDVVTGDGWRHDDGYWTVRANKSGDVAVPAWWQGDRPPRGEVVVLQFDHRDDADEPAIASVFSGLSSLQPDSELHRFGGRGDGQWRTVRIPVTSDLLFRVEPGGSAHFRLHALGADMTVRDFRLTSLQPEDEARYAAETRDWVARAQRRATIAPRYWELVEPARLPAAWTDRALVPYIRTWMRPIRPVDTPAAGEVADTLRVVLFRNELETLQLGLYANGRPLTDVRVAVDPLTSDAGEPVAKLTARTVEITKGRGRSIPDFLVEPRPQRLWPAYAIDVPAGQSRAVWLLVATDETTAKAGRYQTRVRVSADGIEPMVLPLEIDILDARLLTMEEAGLAFGGAVRGMLPRYELAELRRYNHTMLNLWYFALQPGIRIEEGRLALNFRLFDDAMAAAGDEGFGPIVYFLGGNPYRFPRTMHLPRTLAAAALGLDDDGWGLRLSHDPAEVPPEIAPLITAWSTEFASRGRERGWPEVVLTPFDEPAKDGHYVSGTGMLTGVAAQWRTQAELLRAGNPDLRIYASIHDPATGLKFLPDVDVFSTNVAAENPVMAPAVRKAGKTFWEYASVADQTAPTVARFLFGFAFAARNSRGGLVWAYQWGEGFDTLDGRGWTLGWRTPFGMVPSLPLEALREAWDDRRLIETYRAEAFAAGQDPEVTLAPIFQAAAALEASGRFRIDPRATADQLRRWRERITAALLDVRK